MANSYKRAVPLFLIVPGENPRRDFGDIDALAASIEATGGEPVNPPIVVPDGNRYRIVDGERRWRALRKLRGDDALADVIVFSDLGEAEQAVAMMATDDKQALTDLEKARGFQRMLLLGVDEHVVAKASRRKVSDVRKAKQVAPDAPEQATLDQMICAAEFEDEGDRAAVLEAAPDKWAAKAESIRRRNADAELSREFRECILELGFDPEECRPDGYSSICTCYSTDELRRKVDAYDDEELAVWPASFGGYWVLGHKVVEKAETDEERELRERREWREAALEGLRLALLKAIAGADAMPLTLAAAGKLRPENYSWRHEPLSRKLERAGTSREDIDRQLASPMSNYELLDLVSANNLPWWQWVTALVPAAMDDGFQPSEEDARLYGAAVVERAKAEAPEEEDDDIEF